jgi:GT2 family glycosyltransferase
VQPVVDVVILSWFRGESTLRAVNSVLRQVGVRPRVWIVDQGSDTATVSILREVAERHPDVHLTELSENVGVPAGRNVAIALGDAPVVVGVDNDATLDGEYVLRDAVACFDADPALGAIAFRIRNARTGDDDPLSWVHPRFRSAEEAFPAARFCGAAHALRRSAFEACGGYDGRLFFYWEETDLCRRMLENGYRIAYVPSLTALHDPGTEARVGWGDGRFYYCVRNRIYLEHCYGSPPAALAALAAGYVLRGCRNHLAGEALHGIAGAVALAVERRHVRPRTPLSPGTRAYLRRHEGVYGRRPGERARAVLTRLPEASRP